MRITGPLLIAAVFTAGWFVGASRSGTAEARPSASSSCRTDLAQVRAKLEKAQADVDRETARANAADQRVKELVAAEDARRKRLEAATGVAATTLK